MKRIQSLNFDESVSSPGKPVVSPKLGVCPLGQVQLDDFSFEQVIFEDSYERPCVIGQSSLFEFLPVGSSALWIGLVATTSDGQKAAMHLKLDQVKNLIETLQMWVSRCSIDPLYKASRRK